MRAHTLLILPFLFAAQACLAQGQPVAAMVGQVNAITVRIDAANQVDTCNVEINVPGQGVVEKEVSAPAFTTQVDVTPQQTGPIELTWKGKTRFRGLRSTAACSGSGSVKVYARLSAAQVKAAWDLFFTRISPVQAECVQVGLNAGQIKTTSLDPRAALSSPDDPEVKPVFAKCESFLSTKTSWGDDPQERFACNMASGRAFCEGLYAERLIDGKLRIISRTEAMQLHFDNRGWTTTARELPRSDNPGNRAGQRNNRNSAP